MTGCGFCMNYVVRAHAHWQELTPVIKELPLGVMLRGQTVQDHTMPVCINCAALIKAEMWDELVERSLTMFYFCCIIMAPPETRYISVETVEHVKARVMRYKEMKIAVIE